MEYIKDGQILSIVYENASSAQVLITSKMGIKVRTAAYLSGK
jgi:hypothetical protein